MPRKLSTPEARAEAFAFVAAESFRFHCEFVSAAKSKAGPRSNKRDMFCTLPHPDGLGELLCGRDAYDALADLATYALRQSQHAETAELEDVFAAVRKGISARFLSRAEEITGASADSLLDEALAAAAAKQRDTRHFIPCRLMYARNPDRFSVGPVTFRTRERFDVDMADALESHVRTDDDKARKFDEQSVQMGRDYYGAFGWTADVMVLGCAPTISKQRAFLAVQSAVNVLSLLFGNHHTRRMTVGGPVIADMDRRAHITTDADGALYISTSWGSSAASGFEDGWGDFFEREDIAPLLEAGGRALIPLVDRFLTQPLSARFIDAITWFGEAVRETSPASKIVKAVTGIERLVMAGRASNATRVVATRSAMLHADYADTDYFELRRQMTTYYDLRSELAHGQLSPFDPKVTELAPACVEYAERTLLAGLALFHSANILDRALTNESLATGYDQLVEQAEQRAREHRADRSPA